MRLKTALVSTLRQLITPKTATLIHSGPTVINVR